jgi:hypothetical protein
VTIDYLSILETMATHGVAPAEGCSLFGVGYEDVFRRLKQVYLQNRIAARGGSAEKFVVGPFGSGKTHFLRQLMEISAGEGFVTSEVCLDKDLDYSNRLLVYKEITRNLRIPGGSGRGVRDLLIACVNNVRGKLPDPDASEAAFQGWLQGITDHDFKLDSFARIAQKALRYYDQQDEDSFKSACQWLEGTFDSKDLAKRLGEQVVHRDEINLFASQAMFSIFQLIRYAGFKGTVVCLDEADIGFQLISRDKMQKILALLRADIGAINDLAGGAVMFVYALTEAVVQNMMQYMALKQRIDSQPGHGFMDGNDYAALISLSLPTDREAELKRIGHRLTDLLYDNAGPSLSVSKPEVLEKVNTIASEIIEEDISSSSRREMTKRTSVLLLNILNGGHYEAAASTAGIEEDEV